jgi:hypothetical protein
MSEQINGATSKLVFGTKNEKRFFGIETKQLFVIIYDNEGLLMKKS